METPEKLKPFAFHGVLLVGDKEAKGDCVFCDKPDHFFVKVATGQWSCQRCQAQGNIPGFLQHLWQASDNSDEALGPLAEDRGLLITTLRAWGVVKSLTTGEFLIPAFNAKNKLSNLYRVVRNEETGKWVAYGTPTCKAHPFGTQLVHANKNHHSKVWWMEGPWDGMKHWEALGQIKDNAGRLVKVVDPKASIRQREQVLAVPGAGNFNHDWLVEYGTDKENLFAFDNDHPRVLNNRKVQPGWQGMQRVVKLATEQGNPTSSLKIAKWGPEGFNPKLPSGFDARDVYKAEGLLKGYQFLSGLMEEVVVKSTVDNTTTEPDEELEPLPRSTFAELCKDYANALHFTETMREALAVSFAVVISTDLQGDQLWLRLIGPPGSGKTTIAEALSASKDYTFPVSLQTGFHSGYVGGGKSKGKDASLIPQMNGKCCIIKDGDTLLNAPNRDTILSEMRDFYDGVSRAKYRNRVSRTYEGLRITFMICGTDEMRALNRSFLGERFLDCEILGDEDRRPYLDAAARNAYATVTAGFKKKTDEAPDNEAHGSKMLLLKRATLGFLQYLKAQLAEGNIEPPALPADMEDKLKSLGQLLSFMRAKVRREGEGLAYRPRAELATRLVSQMVKLAVCVGVVLGKDTIDEEVLKMVRRVGLSTAEGFQMEITRLLQRHPNGLSADQIALSLNLSKTSVQRYLDDMRELRILHRVKRANKSGIRGRDLHLLTLYPEIAGLWDQAVGKPKPNLPPKKTPPKAKGKA